MNSGQAGADSHQVKRMNQDPSLRNSAERTADDAPADGPNGPASEMARGSNFGAEARERRVLVVDDQPEHVELAVTALRGGGLPAVGVTSVADALAILERETLACAILDIRMPGNEDLAFVERIASIDGTLPVLLLTGHPSYETARRGVDLSVAAYLTKPFDVDELVGRVRQAIRHGVIARGVYRAREAADGLADELADVARVQDETDGLGVLRTTDRIVGASLGAVTTAMRHLAEVVDACLDRAHSPSIGPSPTRPLNVPSSDSLLGALKATIDTLERTKSAFKSKEIAALRRNLEGVVRNFEARQLIARKHPSGLA